MNLFDASPTIDRKLPGILTFDGPALVVGMGAGETMAAGLHLDGVVPHVEEVGGGGAARDRAHPSLQISLPSPTTTINTKACCLVWQPVGPDPVLHCFFFFF